MQKWEYCIITGISISTAGYFGANYPRLIFFSPSGVETDVDLGNKGASERDKGWEKVGEATYVAHTIAKLGLEGWEMVSSGITASDNQYIYFRRPLNNP